MQESIVVEEEQAAMPGPSRSSAAVTDGRCCQVLYWHRIQCCIRM